MAITAPSMEGYDPRLKDVTVVIVSYNSRHCLEDLAKPLGQFRHVIVSDNASTDGCAALAQEAIPHARVLRHKRNLGFGAANNRALAQVSTPFALLLNPDCELYADLAARLLEIAAQFPQAAIVAPQLLARDRSVDVNYRWPSNIWRPHCDVPAQGLCCVGFVTGAVMLLRISEFYETGFFDEDFFLYYEDDDLCLRLFQAKKMLLVAPDVLWLHASRGSVRGNTPNRAEYWRGYHHAQSKIIFARKHQGAQKAKSLLWQTLLLALMSMPFRLLMPSPKLVSRLWGRIVGLWRLPKAYHYSDER